MNGYARGLVLTQRQTQLGNDYLKHFFTSGCLSQFYKVRKMTEALLAIYIVFI